MQKGQITFAAIQPKPSYDMFLMLSQKRRKHVAEAFEIGPSPTLNFEADDYGQVGIWKAPLPRGTAEQKVD